MSTRTSMIGAALLAAALSASTASAHDPKDQARENMEATMQAWQKAATPGAQHRQLADHFVGTWTTKQTMWMDPSAPPMTETGKSVNTAVLGGRQIRMDFSSRWMGQPFEGVAHTGYDNVRGKYTSSWIDNMSTGTMLTDGDYEPATRTYTFRGEMADPSKDGAKVAIRETVRIVDADHHVMEMYEPRGGKEVMTMRIEYARSK